MAWTTNFEPIATAEKYIAPWLYRDDGVTYDILPVSRPKTLLGLQRPQVDRRLRQMKRMLMQIIHYPFIYRTSFDGTNGGYSIPWNFCFVDTTAMVQYFVCIIVRSREGDLCSGES